MKLRAGVGLVSCCLFAFSATASAKDVVIQSTPSGATVSVEGRVLGKTPLQTTKKDIMPGWFNDGAITHVTMSFELPLYEPQTRKFSEFGVPKLIEVALKKRALDEHFENYLSEVAGLDGQTLASDQAKIVHSRNLDQDGAGLYEKGYVMVGYLGVTAEAAPMELVGERAKNLGAGIALVSSKDAGVKSGLREITTRTSGSVATSLGYGMASASTGQTAYGNASAISFVPGRSSTQFVPFEQRQYEVQVAFWRKRAPNALGAYTELIPPEYRQQLKRNTGAYVVALEDNSPAFFANLLVGDVVVGINGEPVVTPDDLKSMLSHTEGALMLEILRDGTTQQLRLDLPSDKK